jgi:hypothetical protein
MGASSRRKRKSEQSSDPSGAGLVSDLREQLLLCLINEAVGAPCVLENQLSLKYHQQSGELGRRPLATVSIQRCLAAVCIIHA